MKNLEEYKNNLNSYTKERRTENKIFKPKNILNETPAERWPLFLNSVFKSDIIFILPGLFCDIIDINSIFFSSE